MVLVLLVLLGYVATYGQLRSNSVFENFYVITDVEAHPPPGAARISDRSYWTTSKTWRQRLFAPCIAVEEWWLNR